MTAKLYKVTVTCFMPGASRADVERFWIAAISRKQAHDKALQQSSANDYRRRNGLVHVHVDNFVGGIATLEVFKLARVQQ